MRTYTTAIALRSIFGSFSRALIPSVLMFSIFVVLSSAAHSESTDRDKLVSEFNTAYKNYTKNENSGDTGSALKFANQSYKLGKSLFDQDSPQRYSLAYNLGLSLMNVHREDAAKSFFKEALERAEKLYGEESPELIPILLDMGRAHIRVFREGREKGYFNKALSLSKKHAGKDSVEYAMLNIRIGKAIADRAKTTNGRSYFNRGIKIIDRYADSASKEYAEAHFLKGRYELTIKDYDDAIAHLEKALGVYEHEDQMSVYEPIARGFLVEAFSKTDQDELATEQCILIGQSSPRRTREEMQPVYRPSPKFPSIATGRGNGWVELLFDVDESGFTREARVTNSVGAKSYESAALQAVEKYRYAPRFENGEPIYTEDVAIRIVFEVSS